MRCPDCHKPIRWLPRENGRRVPLGVEPVPDGVFYIDRQGIVRDVTERDQPQGDVPRFAMHVDCAEGP